MSEKLEELISKYQNKKRQNGIERRIKEREYELYMEFLDELEFLKSGNDER